MKTAMPILSLGFARPVETLTVDDAKSISDDTSGRATVKRARGHSRLRIEIAGQRFGRWVVLSYAGYSVGAARWMCRCDCGTERKLCGSDLRLGLSKSCGCIARERGFLPSLTEKAKG